MKPQTNRREAFAHIQTYDQGKFLVEDLRERREQLMRMMTTADDCELRKLSGACAMLTDILDDFDDALLPH